MKNDRAHMFAYVIIPTRVDSLPIKSKKVKNIHPETYIRFQYSFYRLHNSNRNLWQSLYGTSIKLSLIDGFERPSQVDKVYWLCGQMESRFLVNLRRV